VVRQGYRAIKGSHPCGRKSGSFSPRFQPIRIGKVTQRAVYQSELTIPLQWLSPTKISQVSTTSRLLIRVGYPITIASNDQNRSSHHTGPLTNQSWPSPLQWFQPINIGQVITTGCLLIRDGLPITMASTIHNRT
jgi:hypothetical protein